MKITGAVPTPLDSIESVCDDLLELVPDSILSNEVNSMPFPKLSEVSCGVEETNELGDFLLDAVNWL